MNHQSAVDSLSALAHSARLSVFQLLVEAGPQGMAAGAIAERLGISAPTLSFHLKELANAGLATPRHEGRFVFYSANFPQMAELLGYLTRNCCRGMPHECLTVVETALGDCCTDGACAPTTETLR